MRIGGSPVLQPFPLRSLRSRDRKNRLRASSRGILVAPPLGLESAKGKNAQMSYRGYEMSARKGQSIRRKGRDFYQNDSTPREVKTVRHNNSFRFEDNSRSVTRSDRERERRSVVPLARSLGTKLCILLCAIL